MIFKDLFRYRGSSKIRLLIEYLILSPGFKYTFFMRLCRFTREKKVLLCVHVVLRLILRHYQFKYGICIPYDTQIGSGLYIGHYGGIVVNSAVTLGKNCNISQGVSIGATYGGNHPGVPKVGDNVYIAPGAKIIGGITIGNHAAIGANSVVTSTIPENAVVVGVPGEVISLRGSQGYVINTVSSDK